MSSKQSSISATEKVDATSRVTTNNEPSKTEVTSTVNQDDEAKSHTENKTQVQTEPEPELPVPEVEEDILEIVSHFKTEKEKIKKFVSNGKLMIEDLILFKDKLDDITGDEMDSLINYIATKHMTKVDKYCLSWNELWKIMVLDWPTWENESRNMQRVDDWISEEHLLDDRIYEELDEGNFEREQIKEKGKYVLKLKLDKHLEKISDVFKSYCENIPQSDSESDQEGQGQGVKSGNNTKTEFTKTNKEESKSEVASKTEGDQTEKDDKTEKDDQTEKDDKTEKDVDQSDTKTEKTEKTEKTIVKTEKTDADPDTSETKTNKRKDSMVTLNKNVDESMTMQVPMVKIHKLTKILKDLGYLIDLSFITYDEYVNQTFEKKKTHKEIIKRLQKYCWKRIHVSECIEKVQRGSAKSFGAGILKSTKGNSQYGNTQTSMGKETTKSKRPETTGSKTSQSSDKTKKTTKTLKTENDGTTSNDGKTSNDGRTSYDGKTENDGKTEKDGDSDDDGKTSMSATSKYPDTTAKNDDQTVVSEKKASTIVFEDELFKKEKFTKQMDVNLFIGYCIDFYEEESDILLPVNDRFDTSKFPL